MILGNLDFKEVRVVIILKTNASFFLFTFLFFIREESRVRLFLEDEVLIIYGR